MKKLLSLAIAALVIGSSLPVVAQTQPKQLQIEATILPEFFAEIPLKQDEPDFPWLDVDDGFYTEWLTGSIAASPEIGIIGVSYQYIPFVELSDWNPLRTQLADLDVFELTDPGIPDLPAEALPPELSDQAGGVWVVAARLGAPITPELCQEHMWQLNVTVSNPGRTPFEANERRPGSMFDGGDALYSSDIECDRVTSFAYTTNQDGVAGAWPGWHLPFWDGDRIVGAVIPDQLFSSESEVRTSFLERPPRGVEGDESNTTFTTDSPPGQAMLTAIELDQWPECGPELGVVDVAGEQPGGGEPAPSDEGASDSGAASQFPWGGLGIGLGALAAIYWFWRPLWRRLWQKLTGGPEASEAPAGPAAAPSPPEEPMGRGQPLAVLKPTNPEVSRAAGDIAALDPRPSGTARQILEALLEDIDGPFHDILEAAYLVGLLAFSDYLDMSDDSTDEESGDTSTTPPESPGEEKVDPCKPLRERCEKSRAELARKIKIRDQKDGALRRARARQAELEKAVQALDEFLKGIGDSSIEIDGETVDEIDRRLTERYEGQRRAAFQAAMSNAQTQADRSAASERFHQEMEEARTPEARSERRQDLGDVQKERDETAEALEAARKATKAAETEKALADDSVEHWENQVEKHCRLAEECEKNRLTPEERRARDREDAAKVRRADEEREARRKKEEEGRTTQEGKPGGQEDEDAEPTIPGEEPVAPSWLSGEHLCAEGSTKTVLVATSSQTELIDPGEEMVITFKKVNTDQLEEWLKQTNPDSYDHGYAGEHSKGQVPAQAFLDLTDEELDDLIGTELRQASESYKGLAQLEIVVELKVYVGYVSCWEVWKCEYVADGRYRYVFAGYQCQSVKATEEFSVRTKAFAIDGLQRLGRLLAEVQSWIGQHVGQRQQFCRECHDGGHQT